MLRPVLNAVALSAAWLALAGCGGGGGTVPAGGESPPPDARANFDRQFDRVLGIGPTLTPLTGQAAYAGQVRILTDLNPLDPREAVVGDLTMAVDFDAAVDPIFAEAGGFAGRVNGQATTLEGTLSTANARYGPNEIVAELLPVPEGQLPVTQTGVFVQMEGRLQEPSGAMTGDATLVLRDSFFSGADGAAIFGQANGSLMPDSGDGKLLGGSFYADRQ